METNFDFPHVPLIDTDVKPDGEEGHEIRRYVLDGQQRLTSLLLMRDGWRIKRDGKEISIDPIMYNPDDNELREKGKRVWGHDFAKLLRMQLRLEAPDDTTEIIPRLQQTLREINSDFLVRPLGFYTVKVMQDVKDRDKILSDMAEIFTRINRSGIKLGNLEMFLSFFASESIGKAQITKMYEKMKEAHNLDLEPIIRLVFSNFKRTQSQISRVATFKSSAEYVKRNFAEGEILSTISKSERSLEVVMKLLQNELGISDVDFLPSQTSLVLLARYVFERGFESIEKIPEADKKKMLCWLLVSSFYGLYSSQTDKRLEDDLKIVKGATEFPRDKLAKSMEERNFRTSIEEKDFKNIDFNIMRGNAGKRFLFLLYVLLFKNGATDWAGRPIASNFKGLARHHILPKENEKVREVLDDEIMRNHLGNLTFIDAGKNNEIEDQDPAEYLSIMKEGALREHFIPLDRKLWEPEGYERFISVRTESLWNALSTLMGALC